MLTIMLIPYAVLEYPFGKMADKLWGEKELLSIGFVVVALATASLSFIAGASVIVWTLVLIGTRIGAAAIESMNETYFFKKIDSTDSNILGFFRMVQPLGYVVGPLIATVLLSFIDFQYLFLAFGIILLWGLTYSLSIRDTL